MSPEQPYYGICTSCRAKLPLFDLEPVNEKELLCQGCYSISNVKANRFLRLLATTDFPRWKRWLWWLLRRPVLRPVKHPERFEWVDDDQMDWN